MMRIRRIGWSGLVCLFVCLSGALAPAQAQGKGISDASASALMNDTWYAMPAQYTRRSSEVIVVDKTKKQEVVVPLEKGKEVIHAAYRSGKAHYCGMLEEYEANFKTLLSREHASGRWTKQQFLYIEMLHNYTMQFSLGKIRIKLGEDGKKDFEVIEKGPLWTKPCTDDDRKIISSQILAFIKANAAPLPAAPATQRAEPTPTSQKK